MNVAPEPSTARAAQPASGISTAVTPNADSRTIRMFGADWCGDCRRAKQLFGSLGIAYDWIDLIETPEAAEIAKDISGRTNIPVITYPDGSHQIEPSNADMRAKLSELGFA